MNQHISFTEFMELSPYMSKETQAMMPQQDNIAELYAVVVHEGGESADSGRYYVYIKQSNIWYKVHDDSVTEVDFDGVVSKDQAYILFYNVNHQDRLKLRRTIGELQQIYIISAMRSLLTAKGSWTLQESLELRLGVMDGLQNLQASVHLQEDWLNHINFGSIAKQLKTKSEDQCKAKWLEEYNLAKNNVEEKTEDDDPPEATTSEPMDDPNHDDDQPEATTSEPMDDITNDDDPPVLWSRQPLQQQQQPLPQQTQTKRKRVNEEDLMNEDMRMTKSRNK
jgi:hypothetical protein